MNYIQINCQYCNKQLTITQSKYKRSKSKNFFCNNSCAASYNNKIRKHSKETKEKISEALNLYNKDKKHLRICKVCCKKYYWNRKHQDGTTKCVCSYDCQNYLKTHKKSFLSEETIEKLSIAGRKSSDIQKENRRSKNEKYFCSLCEEKFSDTIHNVCMFNGWDADVIIPSKKIAILWNGVWHYKQIKKSTSLTQIQNRDKIKIYEIEKAGYIPYIIKDLGKYNPEFVKIEFEKFLNFIEKN